jgi:hypothetical protein
LQLNLSFYYGNYIYKQEENSSIVANQDDLLDPIPDTNLTGNIDIFKVLEFSTVLHAQKTVARYAKIIHDPF